MTATGRPLTPAEFAAALSDALGGGEAGLTTLFRSYHPRVVRYLKARDRRHADTIATDTWLAVATGIADFSGDQGAFATWVFTIARNHLADTHPTEARSPARPDANVHDVVTDTSTGVEGVDGLDGQGAVDLLTGLLTQDQADVVLLTVLAHLNVREVATVMGRDERWVRVTHRSSLLRLHDHLFGK